MSSDPAVPADSPEPGAPDAAPWSASVPAALRPALERRGFTALTRVQQAVLAADDGARDLQISSQTGSGKTVAIGLVLARHLIAAGSSQRQGPTTLLIAPTRELAQQVKEELAWLYADLRITCDCVTGGTSVHQERLRLRRHPHVLAGTPGRLLDHIRDGALDLSSVTQLVLDEADQMLDLGFRDELDGILAAVPPQRRTHLVSATFPAEVRALTQQYQRDPLPIEGTRPGSVHQDISHEAWMLGTRERYPALVNLLLMAGTERTLVFVRTRLDTTALADKLAGDGFAALPLNGDLAQAQRTRTLDAFRRGTITTLIATDVAARGLDIPAVTTVVHVDPPIDAATYTHRSGRTGRAGHKGKSVIFVPRPRAGRVRSILAAAKVKADWCPVPGALTVRRKQLERVEARVREALADLQPTAGQHSLAKALLADLPAADLVAGLLATLTDEATRAPFPFDEPEEAGGVETTPTAAPTAAPAAPPAAEPASPEPRTEPAAPARAPLPPVPPAPPAAAIPPAPPPRPEAVPATPLEPQKRARPGKAPSWQQQDPGRGAAAETHDVAHDRGFTRFRINWGRANGAEPKRILAHVCRRGQIDSHMVGAIVLGDRGSTFEVQNSVAASFARAVQRRDPRDPHLVIVRDDGRLPAGNGARRPGGGRPDNRPRSGWRPR